MSNKIKPEQLGSEIMKYLTEYVEDLENDVETISNKIANDAKKELVKNSPKQFKDGLRERAKPYYKGWSVKKQKLNHLYVTKIWNKTNYQLTHLLEFGHATRNGGRTTPIPHIRPVEDKYSEIYLADIKKAIRREK